MSSYSRAVDKFCTKCNAKLSRHTQTGLCKSCCQKPKIDFVSMLKEGKLVDKVLYSTSSKKQIKRFFLDKQENKCYICGIKNIWNEKPIVFVLDHIDGNSLNNIEDNLRLICPNCDSQTDTFKSKNKNGREYDRKYRLEYYHRNKLEDELDRRANSDLKSAGSESYGDRDLRLP